MSDLKMRSPEEWAGARKALYAMAESFEENDDGSLWSGSDIAEVLRMSADAVWDR